MNHVTAGNGRVEAGRALPAASGQLLRLGGFRLEVALLLHFVPLARRNVKRFTVPG
ncbi:hypothetical protein NITHO_1780013 [Nitrolancea hollandica Lb]|uniref:Uncharacterized protein n=1 Tax=Nitrolancea hollandica Lb TaxID=1129897 RepID=I4EED5_9BACT|nr:hypothetical protein NITHO_1780013 [Nitrolancea hollandica Lb]